MGVADGKGERRGGGGACPCVASLAGGLRVVCFFSFRCFDVGTRRCSLVGFCWAENGKRVYRWGVGGGGRGGEDGAFRKLFIGVGLSGSQPTVSVAATMILSACSCSVLVGQA